MGVWCESLKRMWVDGGWDLTYHGILQVEIRLAVEAECLDQGLGRTTIDRVKKRPLANLFGGEVREEQVQVIR